jgi:hypothetical protein
VNRIQSGWVKTDGQKKKEEERRGWQMADGRWQMADGRRKMGRAFKNFMGKRTFKRQVKDSRTQGLKDAATPVL